MAYEPLAHWVSTPNKTDHLTPGYTSKIIYLFNRVAYGLAVPDTADIFETIDGTGNYNNKGTFILPQNYFNQTDGQSFKITLYFYKKLDHVPVDMAVQLYDPGNDNTWEIMRGLFTGPTASGGTWTLVKCEFIISKLYDPNTNTHAVLGNGSMIYSNIPDGGQLYMVPTTGAVELLDGLNNTFNFRLINRCGDNILVSTLIIEEIS